MAMHMKKSFLMVITPMIASMGIKSVEVNAIICNGAHLRLDL